MPASVSREAAKRLGKSKAVVDYKEFAGRPRLHGRSARLGSRRRLRARMGEPPRERAAARPAAEQVLAAAGTLNLQWCNQIDRIRPTISTRKRRYDVPDIAAELPRVHHGEMATTRITTVLSALILGATITTGGGLLAPPALAEPVYTTTGPPAPDGFTYQPLWPFASQDEADRWLRDGGAAGDAPWHADPKTTALSFAKQMIPGASARSTGPLPSPSTSTKPGSASATHRPAASPPPPQQLPGPLRHRPERPVEVVGSIDEALTLSTPQYGSTVGTAIEAGWHHHRG